MDTFIELPYGGPGAGFYVSELVDHIQSTGRDYIIQGQQQCTLENHTKPHSLDVWLRNGFTDRKNVEQAVNQVIQALVDTKQFEIDEHLLCPDSGRRIKGLRLLNPSEMRTKQTRPISVTPEQISVAQSMWESLPGWQRTDRALAMAKEAFPSNTDLDSVWLKPALLDRLYATNVYRLNQAAERVVEVFGTMSHCLSQEIVVELAKVQVNGKTRGLVSFASKYVHFFHDDSIPITDRYAAFTLTRHFGEPKARITDWIRDYQQYCRKIDELIRTSAISPTAREMDHYLWLAGNWVELQEKAQKAQINKGLLAFFSDQATVPHADAAFGSLLR